MATTVKSGFQKLRENLEITDIQASTVSIRQTGVRDAMRAEFDVLDDFLTGSYIRNTMISPLKEADIDIFVVLDPKYWVDGGQATLLDRVKRALKRTYPNSPDISRDGHAVTITFTDFKVDVVPAFYRTGGGYLIPDSRRAMWLATDPTRHITIWSERNKGHNYDLVPLIKMLKAWNKTHGGYLSSFYLETLILQIFQGVTISSFPSGVRFFFDRARYAVSYQLSDPAGHTALAPLGQNDLVEVASRMESAFKRAQNAESADANNRPGDAFYYWRLIFDDYFPAFG